MTLYTHLITAMILAGLAGILCGLSLHPNFSLAPSLTMLFGSVVLAIVSAWMILRAGKLV